MQTTKQILMSVYLSEDEQEILRFAADNIEPEEFKRNSNLSDEQIAAVVKLVEKVGWA